MRITSLFVLLCFILSCSTSKKESVKPVAEKPVEVSSAETLSVNAEYIAKIEELRLSANQRESDFISDLLSTISKFKKIAADTTILSITNLDAYPPADTVQNRIFIENDSVRVQSHWYRGGELLWKAEVINPYMWISDNPEFDYETRSTWVTFTIAIKHTLPKFYNLSDMPQISMETAVAMGKSFLERKQIDSSGLSEYLSDFEGKLLEYGEPELREGLFVWHEPSKQFISYYRP